MAVQFPEQLPPEEQAHLLEKLKQGSAEARELLISTNLRLVENVVRRYRRTPADPDDMFQAGTLGLIKAVDTHKDDQVFPVRATIMIEQEIKKLFKSNRAMLHTSDEYARLYFRLQHTYAELSITMTETEALNATAEQHEVEVQTVVDALNVRTTSMADDFDAVSEEEPIDDQIAENDLNDRMRVLVETLPDLEGKILLARIGFGDEVPQRLTDVAKDFGIDSGRASMLEAKGFARLRHPTRSYKLLP